MKSRISGHIIAVGLVFPPVALANPQFIVLAHPGSYSGLLEDADGNLFGYAGSNVYEVSPPKAGHSKWARLNIAGVGFALGVLLADSAGNLYGTTEEAGKNFRGTIFRLTKPTNNQSTWVKTVLYQFSNGSGGSIPESGLVADAAGNLYGTTTEGGNTGCTGGNGCGTAFKLSPPLAGQSRWTYTVIYTFDVGSTAAGGALIIDIKGNLYGASDPGIIFELSPPANGSSKWSFAQIWALTANVDGYSANGVTMDQNGNLYVASEGGTGPAVFGTVFELSPPASGQTAWTENDLYDFKGGGDLGAPFATVSLDKQGNLYGTTAGTDNGRKALSDVFELVAPTNGQTVWTENILYEFTGGLDGSTSYAPILVDPAGNLYGTSLLGSKKGAVFEIAP